MMIDDQHANFASLQQQAAEHARRHAYDSLLRLAPALLEAASHLPPSQALAKSIVSTASDYSNAGALDVSL